MENLALKHIKLLLEEGQYTNDYDETSADLEFLEKYGNEFSSLPYESNFPAECYGTQKACFFNAYELAVSNLDVYYYVEGFAVKVDETVKTRHAWCVDGQGRVADSTPPYKQEEFHYFGIQVEQSVLRKAKNELGGNGNAILKEIRRVQLGSAGK
ncbi:MAG: hypothetical protein GXP28_02745 [Planctomycetes bacterium]|nr:hypothetical protein [Planctomycetota bacterium]